MLMANDTTITNQLMPSNHPLGYSSLWLMIHHHGLMMVNDTWVKWFRCFNDPVSCPARRRLAPVDPAISELVPTETRSAHWTPATER